MREFNLSIAQPMSANGCFASVPRKRSPILRTRTDIVANPRRACPVVATPKGCAQGSLRVIPLRVIPRYGPYQCLIVWHPHSWPNQFVLYEFLKPIPARGIRGMSAAEKFPQDRIDPRTRPEAILQEAMLGGLFARVPEAIVLLDTDDRVLLVNREFTKIFGYAQEEACGRLINELVVPEELSPEAVEYTRRGLRGESLDVETVRKHKDGRRVHVSIISGPVSISGSQISEYVIYREITERKLAEEALHKSERNLAAIINTIPTTAWTTRPDGYCDFINQVWLDYLGMTAEQAQGWGCAEAIHPDDRKKHVEEWQACLASGTPVDTEARI